MAGTIAEAQSRAAEPSSVFPGRSEHLSHALAEVCEQLIFNFRVFGDQEFVLFVPLAAFCHCAADGQHNFHLIGVIAEGRLQHGLQLIGDGVFQPIHEFQLILDRDVQSSQPVGQIEHHFEKFQIQAPFVLTL